jgi:hypothetical protein
VRYARICFDSRRKKSLTLLEICQSWLLNVLFPSPVVIPDSLSSQGSFKEHHSPHPSSSPVGLPLALQGRPSVHMFSGSLAGSPLLVCGAESGSLPAPRYIYSGFTFVPEEVRHTEMQSYCKLGSRTIASRGTGFESPSLPPTCTAPRA